MAKLSTHVLDIATGKPAAGMRIELFRLEGEKGEKRVKVKEVCTNVEGRTDAPLLGESEMANGGIRDEKFRGGLF